MRSAVAGVLLALLMANGAAAAPPLGADPESPLGHWYNSLEQPHSGISCCSLADCRPVQEKLGANHYWVFIGKQFEKSPNIWIEVPDDEVLHVHNDAGQPVACWAPASGILCFVPGPEA
ncbi:MAG TPA: hypothetical protein VMA86_02420 [Acetobacteraceae bacterium]|nr:hypothetical protein [Acetobacteraceae bacterium]